MAPVLDATEMGTAVEYLFGDDASRASGSTPRGLSPWAGIALALHDARADGLERPSSRAFEEFGRI